MKRSNTARSRSVYTAVSVVVNNITSRVSRSSEPDRPSEHELWNRLDAARLLFDELRTTKGSDLLRVIPVGDARIPALQYARSVLEARMAQVKSGDDPAKFGVQEGNLERFRRLRPTEQHTELVCLLVSACQSAEIDFKRRVRDYADACANDEHASDGAIAMTGRYGPVLDQGLNEYVDREHLYRKLASKFESSLDYALVGELFACTRSKDAWNAVVKKLDTFNFEDIESNIVALPYSTERFLGILGHKHRLYSRPIEMCKTRVAVEIVREIGLGPQRGIHIDHVSSIVQIELVGGVQLHEQRTAMHQRELTQVSVSMMRLYEIATRLFTHQLDKIRSDIVCLIQEQQGSAAGVEMLDQYQALSAFVQSQFRPREAKAALEIEPAVLDSESARMQEVLLSMTGRLYELTGDEEGARELYSIDIANHEDVEYASYAVLRALGFYRTSCDDTRAGARSMLVNKLRHLSLLVVNDTVLNTHVVGVANPRVLCRSIGAQLRSEQSLIVNEYRATGRELQRLRFELEEQIGVRRRQEQRLMEERIALINEVQGLLVRLRQVDEINVRELQQQLLAMLRFIRDLLDGRFIPS